MNSPVLQIHRAGQRIPAATLERLADGGVRVDYCRLNLLLHALRGHATDPLADTIEFLRRDVLNQAMRNTGNHARNHAMQRLPDTMRDLGVDADIIEACRPHIAEQASQLARLS